MKAHPSPDRILVHEAPTSNMERLKPMTYFRQGSQNYYNDRGGDVLIIWL